MKVPHRGREYQQPYYSRYHWSRQGMLVGMSCEINDPHKSSIYAVAIRCLRLTFPDRYCRLLQVVGDG